MTAIHELAELPALPVSRRDVLIAGTGGAIVSGPSAAQPAPAAAPEAIASMDQDGITLARVVFSVNGRSHTLTLDTRTTLLDALREHLHLTGTKKGCDHGQCGACTVIADGRRINACLTLALMHEGGSITTIEGLGTPDRLHPMQAAFVRPTSCASA